MEELKKLLAVKPNVSKVYFNSNGEYMLHETAGFDEVKTREEILGETVKKSKKDKTE